MPTAADLATTKGAPLLKTFADEAFKDAALTILVHAAGITGATGDFLELSDDDWLRSLKTDLMAAVRVTRAFIPGMRKAGWGRIVLFAFEDAVQPYADELPYCAAKQKS